MRKKTAGIHSISKRKNYKVKFLINSIFKKKNKKNKGKKIKES
jgi:hypothetical protein